LTIDHGGLAGNLTVSGSTYTHDLVVFGGTGNDTIVTGSGNDTITGGIGNDAITTGSGNDIVVVNAVVGSSSDSGRVAVSGNNNDTGQDTITGFGLTTDTLRIIATNVSNFEHGTDTAIGTATGGVDNGTQGSFTTSTGLVNLSHEATLTIGTGDAAVTFTTPSTTLTEANFEARLQYDLTGTSGNDTITTGALNDTLTGGAGSDTLKGGAGADHFRYTAPSDGGATVAGADHIIDFSIGAGDIIDILSSGFAGVTIGQEATQVRIGAGGFTDAAQRFNFDTDTHTLSYDSNGSAAGGTTAVLAVLDNAVNITNAQIHFN
jgi:Ca2+-binding RTX toxin-like protein